MRSLRFALGRLLTALFMLTAVAAPASAAPIIANSGFEQPNVGTGLGAYRYGGAGGPGSPITIAEQGGAGWTFLNGAGIAANGSAFFVANAPGNQAGFLQQASSQISQTVPGFDLGLYTLSFLAEGRINYGANPFTVTIDGTPLTFGGSPVVTPPVGTTFQSFTSDPFLVTAGSHSLAFNGLGVGTLDVTSFIDQVSFPSFTPTPVPEPGSMLIFGLSMAGLAGYRCRRRKLLQTVNPSMLA